MKKLLTLTLAAVLLASFMIACTHDTADPATTDEIKTDTPATTDDTTAPDTTEVETEAETEAKTESAGIQGGTGGDGSYIFYAGKYRRDFYGIPIELDVLLGENGSETVDQWLNEEYNFNGKEGKWKKLFTVIDFIEKFDVSKDDFISVMNGRRYTETEIDALFSEDVQKIYAAFVSPNAFYIGETIYTPEMLHGLTLDELREIGISESDISAKMSIWGEDLRYTQFYSDMIELCEANNISYEKFDWSSDTPAVGTEYYTWLPETEEDYFTE